MTKFTHLHVHSHYSLLDGLPKIDELIQEALNYGMTSLALTDHGVMYGAIEFYKKAKEAGLKPIIGQEVYISPFDHKSKTRPEDKTRRHLILLAKNKEGYKNLLELTTKAHLEGFYYKPRMDKDLLRKHAKGLVALSACLNGEVSRAILQGNVKEALEIAREYEDIFGKGNFYLELQRHANVPDQEKVNNALQDISKKTSIPLVATADLHYLHPEDQKAQETLVAINTNKELSDENRLSMKACDLSFHSPQHMEELFRDIPQALENTQVIADKCTLSLELGKLKLPAFVPKNKQSPDQYLTQLCKKGLELRYKKPTKEAKDRLNYELDIIKKTGFASYFLIVWDIVNWAKTQGIIVGPGRGSAAGSLVSYLLNITNVDPLEHKLLFERFLNPDRISPPDIDIDFTDTRRDEVIEYAKKRYGKDHVAQIITFGTLASRASIRDVGRALGYPYSFCDRLAKMIPFGFNLQKSLDEISEFRKIYNTDEKARELIDLSRKLEGVARHASTHACGLVITPQPLTEFTPLQYASASDQTVVTQYEMHSVDDLGLLKMDFLGLRNLSIIENTLGIINKRTGRNINIDAIPQEDEETFKLLQDAKTTGIFQLESEGMKRYLKELKPTSFEDITAMCALYRPGPMELIPSYIRRKHGKEKIHYIHPKLESILGPTYAVGVYQEQMMQIARDLAGFSLPEADILRKAIGKKIRSLLAEQKEKLINGMLKNDIDKKTANAIWELFPPFARYGFNRCVGGDTQIMDTKTGKLTPIKALYEKKINLSHTLSLGDNLKIRPALVSRVYYNGKKRLWRVTTRSGRIIRVTQNHPFLTPKGWQRLENIVVKEKIATPRSIPEPTQPLKIARHKLGLLGYLLAEGNFCHPHGFYFYSKSKDEINDYLTFLEAFTNTIGTVDRSKSAIAVYSKRKNIKNPSDAVVWIDSLGLKYKKATKKFFPDFLYQLSNKDLALLIGKMFQGDGCISIKRRDPEIFYATSSYEIAQGFQHLLLRFGIISSLHQKHFNYKKDARIGFTITISRYDNIEKFIDAFGKHFIGKKRRAVRYIQEQHPIINGTISKMSARGSFDSIPTGLVYNRIKERLQANRTSITAFARQIHISERLFFTDKAKKGYLRETAACIANQLHDESLTRLAESDIFWDEIKKIEPAGIDNTFDLTIEESHNFIANDVFVHNSHAACYALIAYQTAYLKAHYPIEFMTALLNSRQSDIDRLAFFIDETRQMDINVLPPDVNESLHDFTPINDTTIRFGLKAIKNMGEPTVVAIINERKANGPFSSITNFIERIESPTINKKMLEALIKSGTLDALAERTALLENMDLLLRFGQDVSSSVHSGQSSLFGSSLRPMVTLKEATPASGQQKLAWEKELLGLHISGNPLHKYRNLFETKLTPHSSIDETYKNKIVYVGGIVESIKKITTRGGEPMFFLKLKDLTKTLEVTVFPGIIKGSDSSVFQEGNIMVMQVKVEMRQGALSIICEKVKLLH